MYPKLSKKSILPVYSSFQYPISFYTLLQTSLKRLIKKTVKHIKYRLGIKKNKYILSQVDIRRRRYLPVLEADP